MNGEKWFFKHREKTRNYRDFRFRNWWNKSNEQKLVKSSVCCKRCEVSTSTCSCTLLLTQHIKANSKYWAKWNLQLSSLAASSKINDFYWFYLVFCSARSNSFHQVDLLFLSFGRVLCLLTLSCMASELQIAMLKLDFISFDYGTCANVKARIKEFKVCAGKIDGMSDVSWKARFLALLLLLLHTTYYMQQYSCMNKFKNVKFIVEFRRCLWEARKMTRYSTVEIDENANT